MKARAGSLEELGYGEPDVLWPPAHQQPLTRRDIFDRDHPDAPEKGGRR